VGGGFAVGWGGVRGGFVPGSDGFVVEGSLFVLFGLLALPLHCLFSGCGVEGVFGGAGEVAAVTGLAAIGDAWVAGFSQLANAGSPWTVLGREWDSPGGRVVAAREPRGIALWDELLLAAWVS
jgi:hypothetical protein